MLPTKNLAYPPSIRFPGWGIPFSPGFHEFQPFLSIEDSTPNYQLPLLFSVFGSWSWGFGNCVCVCVCVSYWAYFHEIVTWVLNAMGQVHPLTVRLVGYCVLGVCEKHSIG